MKQKVTSLRLSQSLDVWASTLLLAYGFVTVLTPNMQTFDSNGPKFLSLAILNVLVFVYFFLESVKAKRGASIFYFFKSKLALVYAVMILTALLSFFKAWNLNESILHFAKVFTAFMATWMICLLMFRDKKVVLPLAIGMSLMLLLDSIHTFQGVGEFVISGKGAGVNAIKSSYSNKNILTSAIFVKLPFALWLFYFQKKWVRYIGAVALFLGFTATFFLSARAFYLGIITLTLIVGGYSFVRYRQTRLRNYLKNFGAYLLLLVFAYGVFVSVQQTMYPKNILKKTTFETRLKTIVAKDNMSNNLRLTAWGQSWKMIQKDPLLGVGIGNWKIRVLEYENSYSPTYTYMYKNHNDFLETTAEYGILGGAAFIAIFLFVLGIFVKVLFLKQNDELQSLLFLPAIGIVCYAFDAFFNFPQDRPEIQSLFALYIGIGVSLDVIQRKQATLDDKSTSGVPIVLRTLFILVVSAILLGSAYILNANVKSLKLQRIIKEETKRGKLKSTSERFLNGFPAIPDITILEEPIAVQKARYLINEKKYEQARKILYADFSNPFDARKEYFIAMTFYNEKQYDSAMYYAQKGLKLKPYFYNNNTIIASIYERRGEYDKSIALWRDYLRGEKNKTKAWTIPVILLERQKKYEQANALIDSAYRYLPRDTSILKLRTMIKQKRAAAPYMEVYQKAMKNYSAANYQEALSYFSTFIDKVPDFARVHEFRAVCFYRLGQYQAAIRDIDKEEELLGKLSANVINIRGASYFSLRNMKKAKENFKAAMKLGDKDAQENYIRYFGKDPKENISFETPVKK